MGREENAFQFNDTYEVSYLCKLAEKLQVKAGSAVHNSILDHTLRQKADATLE